MKRLFGADGIRGIIGRHPLTDEDGARLGRVLAAWLRQSRVRPVMLIASDTRESCRQIKAAFIDGLTHGGVAVVDVDVLPTAAVSFLVAATGAFDVGAMISASHNPIVENGIKIFDQCGQKITDYAEDEIETIFFSDRVLPWELLPASYLADLKLADRYSHALRREFADFNWKQLRVLIDCAHGAASYIAPKVLQELGLRHSVLNAAPDGTNINRGAGSEHVRQNPRQLAAKLAQHGADVALAVDGDADRMVLVDRAGRFYDGDMLLAMLATQLQQARQLRQATVVATQMSNSGLQRYLKSRSLQLLTTRNGDKYVTEALLAQNLMLGGEEIGHVIVHTDHTRLTGDGLRTALLLLSYLTPAADVQLRDLAPGMVKLPQVNASVFTGRLGRPAPQDIPGLVDLLRQVEASVPDLTRPIECRAASTEPVYRIMLEAQVTPMPQLANCARQIAQHIQTQLNCAGGPTDVLNCVDGGKL
jgi:phosphoglucosamine mutase